MLQLFVNQALRREIYIFEVILWRSLVTGVFKRQSFYLEKCFIVHLKQCSSDTYSKISKTNNYRLVVITTCRTIAL